MVKQLHEKGVNLPILDNQENKLNAAKESHQPSDCKYYLSCPVNQDNVECVLTKINNSQQPIKDKANAVGYFNSKYFLASNYKFHKTYDNFNRPLQFDAVQAMD